MRKLSSTQPTVLIFKESLLPLSETFIEAQAGSLSRFTPRYIGLGREAHSLAVPPDSILLTSSLSPAANFAQKVYRRLGIAPKFHREAVKAKASLIHAHFASGGRSALPLARLLKVPLIVTLHGADVTRRINFRERYEELWNKASLFVCISEFIRRKAAAAGFPEEKLRTLYIGVERNDFRPIVRTKPADLVLFVGRLVEKKGCSFLLQAMSEVKKSNPDVQTVVIGDGPLRSSLELLAKELGVSCQFLGSQPSSVVREWLGAARIFCAPSVTAPDGDSEGLGMVFAEAQAMGTPVVSFRHGGIPEVVQHGKTGLLAPERDSKTLAVYIQRFLQDEHFWKQCVEHGAAWMRTRFDLQTQTQKLELLYMEVCKSAQSVGTAESIFKEPEETLDGCIELLSEEQRHANV